MGPEILSDFLPCSVHGWWCGRPGRYCVLVMVFMEWSSLISKAVCPRREVMARSCSVKTSNRARVEGRRLRSRAGPGESLGCMWRMSPEGLPSNGLIVEDGNVGRSCRLVHMVLYALYLISGGDDAALRVLLFVQASRTLSRSDMRIIVGKICDIHCSPVSLRERAEDIPYTSCEMLSVIDGVLMYPGSHILDDNSKTLE